MLFKNLLSLLFFISFAACTSYQPVSIDVLQPAAYTFPPEIKSVVLVDNSIPFRGKKVHSVKTPGTKFEIDTIWIDEFASLTLQSMKEVLISRNFFDSVYIHPASIKTNPKLVNRALSWLQVDSLCKLYNAEAVIAFEKHIYNTKIDVSNTYDGFLYGYLDAAGAILWRGYNNLSKEQIYRDSQVDTISWDVAGSNISQIATKLPTIKVSIEELANYMGAKASDKIAPYWETQKRGYYISGNYHFIQAADFARKEQYGEAIKLWKYVFDHTNKKDKYRAAYNLAFASEIMGDYESAVYWINQGAEEMGKLNVSSAQEDKAKFVAYTLYLKKRLKSLETLKEQVGGIQ